MKKEESTAQEVEPDVIKSEPSLKKPIEKL